MKNQIDKIFKEFNRVLKHYECPDFCNAICCKYSPIQFEKDEYNVIINTVDDMSREIIETQSIPAEDIDFYKELPAGECPLLHGLKCSIYDHRPLVCQRYPIEISMEFDIIIRPCALGIDLILDYMHFSGNTASLQDIYTEYVHNKNQEVPKIAYVIGSAFTGSKKLHSFSKYLNKTTPENRRLARERLIQLNS